MANSGCGADRLNKGAIVAELWENLPEFETAAEFLAVLTVELDELCAAYGRTPPGDVVAAIGSRPRQRLEEAS